MIRIYLKQAWELMRQNPLFSTLYVVGTGLAIAMTMVMAVVYYVKIAPVYPEVNRMNTLYLSNSRFQKGTEENKHTYQWAVSYKALQDWFYPLENAAVVSGTLENDMSENSYIQPADRSGDFQADIKLTDPNFFRIYSFQFLEGKAFMPSDLESGIHTAVITEDLARRLFGTSEGVVGQSFSLNYINYRVCGVVRSASYLTPKSYAQVYVPYSVSPGYRDPKYGIPYLGAFYITFLVKDDAQADALRAEIQEIIRKENQMHPDDWVVDFWEQPTSHLVKVFQSYASEKLDIWATVRYFLLILLVLLLVPALNLSGMIASRMENRLPEMGVRKSFGAGRNSLLSQVMWENLLLTLLGGLLGLLLAWLALYAFREWVFTVFDRWPDTVPEGINVRVSGEMLFAPAVFASALVLCIILNLLSALIPAWYSLRKPIVCSLNEKR
ncbi:ABC transporter permease [Bacteroides timonensis]|uniref:ABC transporter permease n=1 Tax=Bacteroides timonensis TaxID=1470345 RepID=UPI0005C730E7|nr:ABC transporter permease [Bacteroides timonensis]